MLAAVSSVALVTGLISAAATLPTAVPAFHEIGFRTLYQQGLAGRGAVLEVNLEGSAKPFRLLFDTGARDIMLWNCTAARLAEISDGLTTTATVVRGWNGKPARGRAISAVRVQVGPSLVLDAVPARVLEGRPLRDVDGLIGANVFRDFLLELDAGRNRIRLTPHLNLPPEDSIPFETVGHLMLVKMQGSEGMALVDTGSAYSAVDLGDAGRVAGPADRDFVQMKGVSGALAAGAYRLPPVRFTFSDCQSSLFDREPVAVDLMTFGKAYGVRLTAVIGYPALNGSILQLDFQTRRLRILAAR